MRGETNYDIAPGLSGVRLAQVLSHTPHMVLAPIHQVLELEGDLTEVRASNQELEARAMAMQEERDRARFEATQVRDQEASGGIHHTAFTD